MRNIWDELRYNMESDVLISLVLIVQFVVFFWQGTLIISYFGDTSKETFYNSIHEDYAYYTLGYSTISEENEEALWNQFSDPDFVNNAANTYSELHENPDIPYMVFNDVAIPVEFEELRERFNDQQLLDFHCTSEYPGYYDSIQTTPESLAISVQFSGMSEGFEPLMYRMDQPAMEHFGFRISEGRILEEQDFVFSWNQKEIPVLVGSAYAEGIQVGDILHACMYSDIFQFRVIGILEKNTAIITDQIFSEEGEPCYLDHAILVPYFNIAGAPKNEEERFFASANYEMGLQGGMIVVDANTSRAEVLAIERKICNIFVKNGLYPVTTTGSSYGTAIFKTESERTIQVLMGASVIMGVLSISGICISLLAKLNRNLHRYGIEMMNGQSMGTILLAFLIEILLIIVAGAGGAVWVFFDQIQYNLIFLWIILGLAVISTVIVSTVFITRLKKVDIEEIIRSEE